MVIGTAVAGKIAYALAKDMVNFEAAKRFAPNLIGSSRRWISEAIQQHRGYQQVDEDDEEEGKSARNTGSTEYLVHNWLEALFAWFQVVILWHEPYLSLSAISGLLSSFLFITYFAPRFYATVLIAMFVFNLYKFWFGHVWPEIRVPPGKDREDEMRLDVDRWTYLHPQLMTLAELNQHVASFMKLAERYLYDLLALRQRRPIVFCSKLCFVFVCTAIIGNTLSGLCLVFIALVILMTAPGIYVHLVPDDTKHWLHQTVIQKIFSDKKSDSQIRQGTSQLEGSENSELAQPDSTSGLSSKLPSEYISSSLSSTTKSIEQLIENLRQRSFPLIRANPQPSESQASASSDQDEDDCTDKTRLIDIALDATKGRSVSRKNSTDAQANIESHGRRGSSYSKDGTEETDGLLEFDDDQQDGFVML